MFLGPSLGTMMGLALAGYGAGALPAPSISSVMQTGFGGDFTPSFILMGVMVILSGLLSFFGMRRYAPGREKAKTGQKAPLLANKM